MALFVRRPLWLRVVVFVVGVAAIVGGAVLLVRDLGGPASAPAPSFEPVPSTEPPGPVDTPPPTPPLAMATLLTASDAALRTYDGTQVAASAVPVLARVGPAVAWVGQGPATRVLLVLVATEHPFTFAAGTRLAFTGFVRRAAPTAGRDLGLTGADAAELARQGTYVEVETYTVAAS